MLYCWCFTEKRARYIIYLLIVLTFFRCGHCKKLTPVYDELGQKMASENVDIVKMDATANDVPSGYDVRGFPTLFWVPSDSKKPESYNGGRELDDFVKFIAKSATKELDRYLRDFFKKKIALKLHTYFSTF